MSDTVIFVSITRGRETLTLDGNFCLFRELLTTLNDSARDVFQKTLISGSSADHPEPGKGEKNVSG